MEAAVRGLALLGLKEGETLLLLGGNGSVGALATQLAVAAGVEVITTVRPADTDEVTARGAVAVDYHQPLRDAVRSPVDAVLDASGRSDLEAAVALAGGPARVVTLSDPRAGQFGVTLSAPDPATVPAALAQAVARVEDGTLTVREPTVAPLGEAAEVHTGLEAGMLRARSCWPCRTGPARRETCV